MIGLVLLFFWILRAWGKPVDSFRDDHSQNDPIQDVITQFKKSRVFYGKPPKRTLQLIRPHNIWQEEYWPDKSNWYPTSAFCSEVVAKINKVYFLVADYTPSLKRFFEFIRDEQDALCADTLKGRVVNHPGWEMYNKDIRFCIPDNYEDQPNQWQLPLLPWMLTKYAELPECTNALVQLYSGNDLVSYLYPFTRQTMYEYAVEHQLPIARMIQKRITVGSRPEDDLMPKPGPAMDYFLNSNYESRYRDAGVQEAIDTILPIEVRI